MDPVEQAVEAWRTRRPDLDPSPMLIVGRVQRLWALWDLGLRAPLAAADLHPGDWDVLAALRRLDRPVAPGALARTMLVTAGATTKRIDRLVAAGLAQRSPSPHDGRSRLVHITDDGRALADRLIEPHLSNESALLSPLSAEERETLSHLLGRLLDHAEPGSRE
ncbi:MarR family winged helix-turn-helix transcriptional regulator [Streptomyces sp. TP-A0874]|uniref:MarR family winged helix-turn-helix transcriptional regulator n=1 Tax=Streptomyces sp. TP-A0874 TaxID=549819 RepID=UPI001FCCE0BF|nr:MarR family transcriptional regulator [Streptomyces sp. TP-A0874]